MIAKDSSLVMDLVNHLLQMLNYGLLYDEKGQGKEKKLSPKPLVLSATAALGEIMQTDEMATVVAEHYALILGSLLLRVGTSAHQPEAIEVITDALNAFLTCANEDAVKTALQNIWSSLSTSKFTEVCSKPIPPFLLKAYCLVHAHRSSQRSCGWRPRSTPSKWVRSTSSFCPS